MSEQTRKERIAILGGGMGSVAAAFALSDTPELRECYELTVYQMGWRIGGKGASGRNREVYDRIEEHGLHTWFGFYENAFAAMRRCYEELGRPPDAPLATWQDAFKGVNLPIFHERFQERWHDWPIPFPTNDALPGDGEVLPTFWDIASEALQWLLEVMGSLVEEKRGEMATGEGEAALPSKIERWDELVEDFAPEFHHAGAAVELRLLEMAIAIAKRHEGKRGHEAPHEHVGLLCRLVGAFKSWFWKHVVAPNIGDDRLRELFIIVDTGSAILCGIAEDDILAEGFESADGMEIAPWLRKHGAREDPTLTEGPPLRAAYDMVFGYMHGNVKEGTFAAGTAVNALIRIFFTYKGSVFYRMQAGMGDTVFGPFYEVLRRRGVRFEFFRSVRNLRLSEDKRLVESIEVVPQVEILGGTYEPLYDVKGLPCWPSEPLWEQLKDGEALKARGVNFEWEPNPLDREATCLRMGQDYDRVVLGITLAVLPSICGELIEHDARWKEMVGSVKTVMTQAFQVWMSEDPASLGWRYDPTGMAVTYVEPLSTLWNMDQLLDREAWPERFGLRNIGYVCGVLQDERGDTQERADRRAKAAAIAWLESAAAELWPDAVDEDGVLDWSLLVDPEEREGAARFDAQYWRANFNPTERYVLSVAGSTSKRIPAGESGFDNLYLAGDWVRTGFDAGCIEAATMAGLQAARAICGHPTTIVGEEDPWF